MKTKTQKQVAKEERIEKANKEDQARLFEKLKAILAEKYTLQIGAFSEDRAKTLPAFMLYRGKTGIGFADVLFGKREEYIKLGVLTYRSGIFVAEHFGIIAPGSAKGCERMRYVVFLLNHEQSYRWSYNPDKIKPHPTLLTDEGLMVCIKKNEWEPL